MNVLDALADPTRRRIVELLADHDRHAGELAASFTVTRPAISQHLRVLLEHGLVRVRADGTGRIYTLNPAALAEVEEWARRTRVSWAARLDALGRELRRGDER